MAASDLDGAFATAAVRRRERRWQLAGLGVLLALDDLLMAGRQAHGLTRLDEIDHAILETNGTISIAPVRPRRE